MAVHTPHIGGVLHVYQHEGPHLSRRRLLGDVSAHRIGTRAIDLSVWLRGLLVLPSQDGRRLRVLNPAANWAEQHSVPLPARIGMATALADESAMAVLGEDGRVWVVGHWGQRDHRRACRRVAEAPLRGQQQRQTQARAALWGRKRPQTAAMQCI